MLKNKNDHSSIGLHLDGDCLLVDQGQIQRHYAISPNGLSVSKIVFDGKVIDSTDAFPLGRSHWNLSRGEIVDQKTSRLSPVGQEGTKGIYRSQHNGENVDFHFFLHHNMDAITQWIDGPGADLREPSVRNQDGMVQPTGVEVDGETTSAQANSQDELLDVLFFDSPHLELHHVQLLEQTDQRDNLVSERTYSALPFEKIELEGCLYWLENPLTQEGWVVIKWAPQPYARPEASGMDARLHQKRFQLLGMDVRESGASYPWTIAPFKGGKKGASRVIYALQKEWRVWNEQLDGVLLSNTWGDRNRDAALSTPFMTQEFSVAQDMGIEVVQIDDGWQRGITANSALADKDNGVWEGFYDSDDRFWDIHSDRFGGAFTFEKGPLGLGLWFAPDSAHEFKNWERDVESVMKIHREHHVRWIKIDSVKAFTKMGELRLNKFFDAVLKQSEGNISFDFDITAEIRPGFLGLPHVGHIFVENRYTDWAKYWPHSTLKNVWELSATIPPSRLRMEFLNPDRNAAKYGDDPLAPVHYKMDTIFATVMLTAPLAWFELQFLSTQRQDELRPLLKLWKTHRQDLQQGMVHSLGTRPNGASWTGFHVESPNGTEHLLVFRERFAQESGKFEDEDLCGANWVSIYGDSTVESVDGGLRIRNLSAMGFGWFRRSGD